MKRFVLPDRMPTGFLIGFLFPVIVFLAVYLFTSGDRSFSDFLFRIQSRNVVTHFMSLCVFPNVFIFLIFNRFDKYRSSRGVLGITIIWALAVFLIKMI